MFMKAEFKQPWIDALRSGDYKQGRNALNLNGRFCCLGVLCEITNDIHKTARRVDDFTLYFGGDGIVSPTAVEFFGLPEFASYRLMDMNDIELKSFSEIADWIEENL
jgi:hypothetical protein